MKNLGPNLCRKLCTWIFNETTFAISGQIAAAANLMYTVNNQIFIKNGRIWEGDGVWIIRNNFNYTLMKNHMKAHTKAAGGGCLKACY